MENLSNQESPANPMGFKNPAVAFIAGIFDIFFHKSNLKPMPEDESLEGKTALVTGASSGLGKAVAIQLAERGTLVIMACRSKETQALEEVKTRSGNQRVEMVQVDLSDLESVRQFCDSLRDQKRRIDITVLNAGLMPLSARRGPQGFELMFMVHFLANRLIVHRALQDQVIVPETNGSRRPRIVFVSSEAHRTSEPINFDEFGAFVDYGLKGGMAEYSRSKLHLCTYATELAARLNPLDEVQVAVHSLCPGPIASNIAREAPLWLEPLLNPLMRLLFSTPARAANAVMLLAGASSMQVRNGVYLHMMREKVVSELASDPVNRQLLWEKSELLLGQYLTPGSHLDLPQRSEESSS